MTPGFTPVGQQALHQITKTT